MISTARTLALVAALALTAVIAPLAGSVTPLTTAAQEACAVE